MFSLILNNFNHLLTDADKEKVTEKKILANVEKREREERFSFEMIIIITDDVDTKQTLKDNNN